MTRHARIEAQRERFFIHVPDSRIGKYSDGGPALEQRDRAKARAAKLARRRNRQKVW